MSFQQYANMMLELQQEIPGSISEEAELIRFENRLDEVLQQKSFWEILPPYETAVCKYIAAAPKARAALRKGRSDQEWTEIQVLAYLLLGVGSSAARAGDSLPAPSGSYRERARDYGRYAIELMRKLREPDAPEWR